MLQPTLLFNSREEKSQFWVFEKSIPFLSGDKRGILFKESDTFSCCFYFILNTTFKYSVDIFNIQ